MPNLTELSQWDAGIYEFQTTDPVQGGHGGIDNQPHQNLVNRALWTRNRIAAAIIQAGLTEGTSDNTQLAQCVILHVSTINALRLVPIPVVPNGTNCRVLIAGKLSSNDGQGQLYQWNFSDTTADDGQLTIQPSSLPAAGRWNLCGINASFLGGQNANAYALQSGLNAESVLRAQGDGTEASIRASADTNLQSNITAESVLRSLFDQSEAGLRTSADNNEATTRLNADTALAASVTTEANTRSSVDVAEAAARVAGDAATLTAAENFAFPGSSLGTNGYRKNPDGSIDMWGTVANGGLGPVAVNFPTIAGAGAPGFPTVCLVVISQCLNIQGTITQSSVTKNGFVSTNGASGSSTMWHAIGR